MLAITFVGSNFGLGSIVLRAGLAMIAPRLSMAGIRINFLSNMLGSWLASSYPSNTQNFHMFIAKEKPDVNKPKNESLHRLEFLFYTFCTYTVRA